VAVFTFSTKDKKKPEDTRIVEELKKRCDDTGACFSTLMVRLVKEHVANERPTKV